MTPSAISAALSALGEIRRERSSAISAFRLRLARIRRDALGDLGGPSPSSARSVVNISS
ncbi:MAG TPA: hypothetical protein VL262_11860 [Vicinamibacterales bacterium]|nr:hypothetical protein [Vicinamibacterales bacterium]